MLEHFLVYLNRLSVGLKALKMLVSGKQSKLTLFCISVLLHFSSEMFIAQLVLAHHPLQQLGKQLPREPEGLNSQRSADTSKWRSDE